MRNRVAAIAACAVLITCIIFAAALGRSALDQMNRSSAEDLAKICRMSADYLDTAAFLPSDENAQDVLEALATRLGVGVTLMDENGTVVYDTRVKSAWQLYAAGNDFEQAIASGEGTDFRSDHDDTLIFSAVRLQSGYVLRLWRDAEAFHDFLGANYRIIIVFLAALLAVMWTIVSLLVRESDQLTKGAMNVLEAFSEGRFDERVTAVHGLSVIRAGKINQYANRIEQQIARRNSRNQALSVVMNEMQNGLLAVNAEHKVILMTPVARKLLGVHDQVEGTDVSALNRDVNLEPIFAESMDQSGVYTAEIAVREGTTGRGHTPLRLYISPMRRDGNVVGAMAMIEDITELRRLEQMRTDFSANVSHELKTPLTSIRGFVETLLDGAIDNPEYARKFLNIIMMEVNRLTRLVNDILSISKLESGDTEVSLGRLRLDQIADDVCEMLQIHAKEKQIALSINENTEPIYVWGNADRVEQMVLNLVENAIKYNQPGGTVHVSVYGTEEHAYFLVSDTGIGIAEKHLPRLFERFYRVDKGRSRSMGGTGLGLAIVKHIVGNMGGNIEVHSKLGEGTEFSVTLPRYHDSGDSEEADAKDET